MGKHTSMSTAPGLDADDAYVAAPAQLVPSR